MGGDPAASADADRRLARCRVVRVAARLPSGLPLLLPLWFVPLRGSFFLTQRDGSPLVRSIVDHPEVVLLFGDAAMVRITGSATVVRGRRAWVGVAPRIALRYHLHPRAVHDYVRHWRRFPDAVRYYVERGRRAVLIRVDPLDTRCLDV